jgi:uncharacterized protein (TIGR03085 family)
VSTLARTERTAICDLLIELGPDQPTLCEGWQTRDLAAHLVLREGRPDAAAGIVVKRLAPRTARMQRDVGSGDFGALIQRLRSGPPKWSLLRIGRLDEITNNIEFFIHHEDVRRAQPQWQPRVLDTATDDLLWQRGRRMAHRVLRFAPAGVDIVRTTTGERLTVREHRAGEETLTLAGTAQELLIYLFGRHTSALVEREGDPTAFKQIENS